GSLLSVVVEPRYFQTVWFKASIIVAAGLMMLAAQRFRQARRRDLERLRVQIASDLHDELGSNLGSIALKTELLTEWDGLDAPQRAELSEINQVALETANQLRDVAWFINPEFDTLGGMILRMQEVAARLLDGRQWEITVEPMEKERRLRLEIRRNLFSNYKEILHNIAKHSSASRVEILVAERNGSFELIVRDNGCGFDPQRAQSGAGLRNLQRRTLDLKGELFIHTNPGKGTEVRVVAQI
ncbi:MAG TPA: ATP-binding protein, partial [Verrucomicrobiae bacterium]|nr:ATP-binding protein [Verrucomicrobiae bacterium]